MEQIFNLRSGVPPRGVQQEGYDVPVPEWLRPAFRKEQQAVRT
jgi:hypothetical protein